MKPSQGGHFFCALVVAGLLLLHTSLAAAQSAGGPTRIGGFVSGAVGSGHSTSTVGLSGMYKFTPRFGVEGDLTHLSDLTVVEFTSCRPGEVCAPASFHARISSVTANFVAEVPIGVRRLRPYVAAGAGAARIRRDARSFPDCSEPCVRQSETRPVISAGGGVDFLVWRGLGLGLDLRYQRVYEDERLYKPAVKHLTRIGSFVSYRF